MKIRLLKNLRRAFNFNLKECIAKDSRGYQEFNSTRSMIESCAEELYGTVIAELAWKSQRRKRQRELARKFNS